MAQRYQRASCTAALAALLLAGCGGLGERVANEKAMGDAEVFSTRMEFADLARQADPVVAVQIAGHRARLIVDTGANPTILTETFAAATGIDSGPASSGSERGTLELAIGDVWTAMLPISAAIVPAIPEFDAEGISGLLSPLSLGSELVVILDFPRHTFWALPRKGAEATLAAIYAGGTKSTLTRVPATFGLLVLASIDGGPEVPLDLDTGKAHTAVCNDYLAADAPRRAGPHQKSFTGQETRPEIVPARTVTLADRTVWGVDVVVQTSAKEIDGVRWCGNVGMDVLRGFAVVIFPGAQGNVLLYGPRS